VLNYEYAFTLSFKKPKMPSEELRQRLKLVT